MLRTPGSHTVAAVTGMLLTVGGATACATGGVGSDPERVDVVAAFYPLQFVAERVGGDAVKVVNLAKPGAEPHHLELSPGQVGQVSTAELIVYLKGFQPAVDDAVAQQGPDRAFDVAGVQPLLDTSIDGEHQHQGTPESEQSRNAESRGTDPHVWLDPTRLVIIGERLADRLGDIDPDHAADYTTRAAALRAELETLDRDYEEGLRACQRREVVVSHAAFGYLTQRYRLEQIAVSGLAPESEPSPQRLAKVIEEAKKHQATTIFFETLASPKVAKTIAKEMDISVAVLDPLEGLRPGSTDDYFSVMRANLAVLKPALGCS